MKKESVYYLNIVSYSPQIKVFFLSRWISFLGATRVWKLATETILMGHSDLKSDWSWKYAFQYLLSALNSKDLQMNSKKFSPRGHSYLITFQLRGHSCKIGNVRYGGTSKIQNWNYQTFGNFLLKFFQTYVIQLEINNGPPLFTFWSPIMEDYKILDVLP